MRFAVAGKGGSGKTSIAGSMARMLGRRGHRVLAIDGDSSPNLAVTLGFEPAQAESLPALPRDLSQPDVDGSRASRSLDDLHSTYVSSGPDNVSLVITVRAGVEDAGEGCLTLTHRALRSLIEDDELGDRFDIVLLDTEGTPEHFARGTSGFVDTILVVAEPHFASLEAARRMSGMGRALGIPRVLLVANKVRSLGELEKVQAFAADHALELAGTVPWDGSIADAERAACAPLDFQPDGPAMRAVGELAAALEREPLSPPA